MVPQIKAIVKALDECESYPYQLDHCKIWVQDLASGLSETTAEEEKRQICLAAGCKKAPIWYDDGRPY